MNFPEFNLPLLLETFAVVLLLRKKDLPAPVRAVHRKLCSQTKGGENLGRLEELVFQLKIFGVSSQ